ncbi:MAG TPA: amidohydrolase family protein [Thermomicrobiales bacterium]|nr:amidohydrolase family protein [Thermomicrobiales bacterium]
MSAGSGDVIYTGALVRTLNREQPTAEAVLVRGERVAAVGALDAVRAEARNAREVDLAGATLLPGFIESHNHFLSAGQAFAQVDVRASVCDSIATLQTLLGERAERTEPGQWVIGRGYDQTLLAENRHPTRHDLDAVSSEHPIVIFHISYHGLVANSMALRLGGVDRNTSDVPGGEILRGAHGEPNGVLLENPAMSLVSNHMPEATSDTMRAGLRAARDQYLPVGVSTVHDALIHTRQEIDAYAAAMAAGELPIRAYLMIHPDLYEGDLEGQAGDLGPSYGLPAQRLVAGPVKFFQDGAIQAYTAALTQPYFDAPDRYGVKIHDPADLASMVLKHHRAGRQIAIHGNGDAAIDDILDAYEAALQDAPRANHRHRIEHCQTAREDQLERMARHGVVSSVFANHLWFFGDRHLSRFLGPERAERMEPLASMTRLGITWGLHSDCPVTEVNPLLSIWLAVNRRTSGGQPIGEDQKVSVEQALRGFGPDAAYLGFQEQQLGTIAPGYLADFVVLSGDPADDPESIKDLRVLATIIGGDTALDTSTR